MEKRNEDLGFNLMNTDSPNRDRIPGDCHRNDTTTSLPVGSPSPFPSRNLNAASQYYSRQPAGGNSRIDSSQSKSYQNLLMDHNYTHRGVEHNFLPCRPGSIFPSPEGHTGWQYQHNRLNNQTIPTDVSNAAFNLNSFEKPDSVTLSYGSARRPQMVNPSRITMSGNIGLPPLDMNLGMSQYNPNQGGAEPLLAMGKCDENFMSIGSGSSKMESESSAVVPKVNVRGNSERAFFPPSDTDHNQLGSRSSLSPGLDMNGAFSAFQNDSEIISNLAHAGNHEALFDSRPVLRLGPSYAFQSPAAGDQNHYLGKVNRDLGLGNVKNIGMEFTDVGHKNGLERCMDLNSLPIVGSQSLPFESGQSRVNRQLVSSSSGMVTDKLPTELFPINTNKFSSQFPSRPLAVATRSTRGQDPSSHHGQSQAVGSIQQSNSPLRPHSTSGPAIMSSLKRPASQPLSSTVQNQHRKTLPTQFIHPSIPTWTRLDPSVLNANRAISPLVRPAQSLTPQATHSVVPPSFPTTQAKSAVPAPNTTRAIPPLMHTAPVLPPNDKRISSFHHPSSHTSPRTNQFNHQLARARQRLKAQIMPSASGYIKFKDETPEPIGYKCFLCKRDLSYSPEGPISLPPTPPAVAVLSCGHTFHDCCLERITPDDQSHDPPCIPCALGE
ncbi:uncharacterized protein LOC109812661 isoform X2 [Cajanus cajan]|uniref:uncharacterized protein LOC109812661 isoform X2 n=1 Tax=Cajanus cajan TaxID=3821 RepID=UPI00098DCA45|nr:uncharacterized protein LOC109812661 isoform X2 [Cajanus cajan]